MGLRLHKGDIDTRSVEDVRSLTVAVPCWCIAFSLLWGMQAIGSTSTPMQR